MSENDPYAGSPYGEGRRGRRRRQQYDRYDDPGYSGDPRARGAHGGYEPGPGSDPLTDSSRYRAQGAGREPDPLTDPWPYRRSPGGSARGGAGGDPSAGPPRQDPSARAAGYSSPRERPPREGGDPLTDPWPRHSASRGADHLGDRARDEWPGSGDRGRTASEEPGRAAPHHSTSGPVPVPGSNRDATGAGPAETGWRDDLDRPRGRRRKSTSAGVASDPGEPFGPEIGPTPSVSADREPRRGRRRKVDPGGGDAGYGSTYSESVPAAREPWSDEFPVAGSPGRPSDPGRTRRPRVGDRDGGGSGPGEDDDRERAADPDEDDRPWGADPDADDESEDDLPDHQERVREAFERRSGRRTRDGSEGRARRGRDKRKNGRKGGRRRRGKLAMTATAAVLALVVVAGGLALRTYMFPPDFDGDGTGEVEIAIREGETGTEVGDTLVEQNVVASTRAFTNALGGEELTPGTYMLRSEMSGDAAVAMLLDPASRSANKVTIREGLRSSQILEAVAEETPIEHEDLVAAYENHEALGLPDYAEQGPEGYLYPDTYTIEPDDEAEEVLAAMVERFEQTAEEIGLEERADDVDMTPNEVMANAAIIQAEAGGADDMPKISRVVHNRLEADMELGMDSTCFYVIEEYGIALSGTQLQACESAGSDYATYGRKGLPSGPIVSPGADALNAALDPAEGEWLYFVATDPDAGVTEFAETHEEFEELKRRFEENRTDQ